MDVPFTSLVDSCSFRRIFGANQRIMRKRCEIVKTLLLLTGTGSSESVFILLPGSAKSKNATLLETTSGIRRKTFIVKT